jgi:hypothetical protein
LNRWKKSAIKEEIQEEDSDKNLKKEEQIKKIST